MKKVFLFLLIAFLWVGASAQTVLYQDDMESYTVGGYLAAQNSTWWTTWENLPGTAQDALIANNFSHSTSKSFKVSKGTSSTDLIMKLGNKTSGSYELNWWMYIETNKDAYYNLQHFQSPGIEWAYEIYFYGTAAANNGTLMVGGDTTTKFSYPKATWFPVRQKINLDKDSIELIINDVLVKKWPFSYQASGTTGTLQLGGVDFYADQTYYTYYVDDVSFTQMGAATVPGIKINPTSINTGMTQGGTQSVPLTIGDTGTAPLNYNVLTIYDSIQDLGLTPTTAAINYDGDNASAIGFNNVPITASVAAKYLNAVTVADAG
ncbi:MAG: hypothetical protein ACM3N9_04030, partial [Syntrophothermus sp.]